LPWEGAQERMMGKQDPDRPGKEKKKGLAKEGKKRTCLVVGEKRDAKEGTAGEGGVDDPPGWPRPP